MRDCAGLSGPFFESNQGVSIRFNTAFHLLVSVFTCEGSEQGAGEMKDWSAGLLRWVYDGGRSGHLWMGGILDKIDGLVSVCLDKWMSVCLDGWYFDKLID